MCCTWTSVILIRLRILNWFDIENVEDAQLRNLFVRGLLWLGKPLLPTHTWTLKPLWWNWEQILLRCSDHGQLILRRFGSIRLYNFNLCFCWECSTVKVYKYCWECSTVAWSGTGNKEHWYLINHYLFSLGTVQTTDCRLTPGLEVHVIKVDKCKSW